MHLSYAIDPTPRQIPQAELSYTFIYMYTIRAYYLNFMGFLKRVSFDTGNMYAVIPYLTL